VVLLDLVLPDGNGMELFPEVDELADSEIVLITGLASLDTSIEALALARRFRPSRGRHRTPARLADGGP
jgi:ActR/RegA family two-component response regulator